MLNHSLSVFFFLKSSALLSLCVCFSAVICSLAYVICKQVKFGTSSIDLVKFVSFVYELIMSFYLHFDITRFGTVTQIMGVMFSI